MSQRPAWTNNGLHGADRGRSAHGRFQQVLSQSGHGEEADLVWEIIDSGLGWMTVALHYAAMNRSGGMEKLIGVVGETSRTMDGFRNGCGEDSPVLRTPFIRPIWCEAAPR
jgi:hypothetical protein